MQERGCYGEDKIKYWKGKLSQKHKKSMTNTSKLTGERSKGDISKPVHKKQSKIKTKKIKEEKGDQSFKEALNKFKKLFDEKLTPKARYHTDQVKGEKGKQVEPITPSESKRRKCFGKTDQVRVFTDIFNDMQKKISDCRMKGKTIMMPCIQKSKSKSKDKKTRQVRSKSQKQKRVCDSVNKSVNLPSNRASTTKRKRIMTQNRRDKSPMTNSKFKHQFPNIRNFDIEQQKRQENLSETHQQPSVIVYDFSISEHQNIKLQSIEHADMFSAQQTIEIYLKGILQFNRFKQLLASSIQNSPSRMHSISTKSQLRIEEMIKQQQAKWLQLKANLQHLKNSQNKEQYLDEIIREVNANHQHLQSINLVDSRKSEDFSDRSQKNLRKVGQYDEAPLQIKNIMKRKSREEICKESEIVSLEISRKQFKEDLQLMEYMCSKKDLLTHSQENMKMSLGSQGQGKGLIKDKELEQEIGTNKRDIQAYEKNIEEICVEHQNEKKDKEGQEDKEESQKHISEKYHKQPQVLELEKQQTLTGEPWQCQNIKYFVESASLDLFSAPISSQNHIDQVQPLKGNESSETDNKLVRAMFESKRKQRLDKLVFAALIDEFAQELFEKSKNQLFTFYNDSTIQVNEHDKQASQYMDQCLRKSSTDPYFQRVQSDEFYVNSLMTSLIQYIRNNFDLTQRLKHPLGVNSLYFLKCMRMLNNSEGGMDESGDFELEIDNDEVQNYQELLSQEDFCRFEEERQIQIGQGQYIFNRALYDLINIILDTLRPFGKKGRPPICFIEEFQCPPFNRVEQKVYFQLKKVMDVRLGYLNFDCGLQTIEIQKIVNTSLTKFKHQTVQQIQQQYQQKSQDLFQICYDLMLFVQLQILTDEAILLQKFHRPMLDK